MWVDDNQTLWADRNLDTWQLPVLSCDGLYCGNVVGQIVEPKQCLVRYFIIFSPQDSRQFLLPSDSISKIDARLHCLHPGEHLQKIPTYSRAIPKLLEQQIAQALAGDAALSDGV